MIKRFLEFDNNKIYFHGTNKRFDEFNKSVRGSYGKGFYFTQSEGTAFSYGNIIMKCKLILNNPFYLNSDTFSLWSNKYYNKDKSTLTKRLISDGYDSVVTQNEVVVFESNQIIILG